MNVSILNSREVEYDRTIAQSPIFNHNTLSLGASASAVIDLASIPNASEHLPFDFLSIANNNSTCGLYIYFNQGANYIFVPKSYVINVDKATIGGLWSLKITNASSSNTIASGDVILTMYREAKNQPSDIIDNFSKAIYGLKKRKGVV